LYDIKGADEMGGSAMKKLYRSDRNKMVAGVCAGIAEYFELDVSLVRLLWVLMIIFGGSGLLLYIIAWVVIPERETSQELIGNEEKLTAKDPRSNTLIGVLLIGLGALLLFDHFFPWRSMARFWPVVLIIVGAIMITGWRGERK
jgi:phage shock protein C